MGCKYTISSWYKIKHEKRQYPWPCESDRNRLITIRNDDVLTKSKDGTFMKHTGLGCFGITIPDDDLIKQDESINLQVM